MKTVLTPQAQEMKNQYDEVYEQIINELKLEMTRQDITQEQLGEMVGLKQPAIARLLNPPYCPRFDTLFKLITALNMEVNINKKSRTR